MSSCAIAEDGQGFRLETKKDNWGIADKETRALAKQAKAKMRLARQALDDLALG
ncbi:hypothetical protein QJQ45_022810, partial [Haematococcus lacustris]